MSDFRLVLPHCYKSLKTQMMSYYHQKVGLCLSVCLSATTLWAHQHPREEYGNTTADDTVQDFEQQLRPLCLIE